MQHSLKYYLTLTLFLSFFISFAKKGLWQKKIKITGNYRKHQATSRIRDSHYYKLKKC
jgi:hypothetical protein